MMSFVLRSLVLGLAFFVAACSSGPAPISSVSNSLPSSARPSVYLLDAGDKLRVIVFGEADLSGEFVLDEQGTLDLPLIGDVPAKGKSLQEVETAIVTRLKDGYLKDPKVSLEILNYRPFFIQGEVKNAGEYPYKADLTVQDAIAIAGGFTYRANQNTVYIRKVGSNEEVRVHLGRERAYIHPGDSIRVGERFF
ncbi:MAG: polysaccharide export protein [Cohaesibacter sp.]|jgi:polysaccharide export outer membrane protein|nr:polysaccharide export protein [Cohaesibacter sp.]